MTPRISAAGRGRHRRPGRGTASARTWPNGCPGPTMLVERLKRSSNSAFAGQHPGLLRACTSWMRLDGSVSVCARRRGSARPRPPRRRCCRRARSTAPRSAGKQLERGARAAARAASSDRARRRSCATPRGRRAASRSRGPAPRAPTISAGRHEAARIPHRQPRCIIEPGRRRPCARSPRRGDRRGADYPSRSAAAIRRSGSRRRPRSTTSPTRRPPT